MSAVNDYTKYAVLYVDDEEQALKYFRKGLNKEFQILIAPNVAQATEILERQAGKIGVVITDQRMPGQSGTELLARLRRDWPNMVRILVTAYADIESAISAVNDGAIYKYLTKPVDFAQLRETLRNALDLFIVRSERDDLLREKMGVLRRMIVADRVRSFAEMAGGISHHLRNSMTAMSCYLEEAEALPLAGAVAAATVQQGYADALWTLARQERDKLVEIVQKVERTVVSPQCRFTDEATLEDLVRRGIAAAGVDAARVAVSLPPGPAGRLTVDGEMVVRLFKALVAHAARHGGAVSITAKPAGGPGPEAFRILVMGQGGAWSDQEIAAFFTPFAFPTDDPSNLGLDMLVAFFVAYHHGGDLLVHKAPPAGPGFELLLPLNPADVIRPGWQEQLLEKLFMPSDVVEPAA